MNIVVVEPHSDDAFLSLGAHIERWVKRGDAVNILTVCSGTRKRAEDAQAYAKAVGASWQGLGFEDTKLDHPLIDMVWRKDSIIIGPLGIQNEDHLAVVKGLPPRALRYIDQPYATIQKNSEEVTRRVAGLQCVSYLKPGIRKWRHIPLFKDQAKFFHYNPPEKLREGVEMIFSARAFSGF